jgi:predicted nuclease of restriction endonuclease-like (RecB) superfamily
MTIKHAARGSITEAARQHEVEAANENWSVPHLERQIHTYLHLRLLKSRDKEGVRALAGQGADSRGERRSW